MSEETNNRRNIDERRKARPNAEGRIREERRQQSGRSNGRKVEKVQPDIEHMLAGVDADEEQYILRREQRKAARLRQKKRKQRALIALAAMTVVGLIIIGLIIGGVISFFKEDPFEEGIISLEEYDYLGAIEWYEMAIEEENNVAASYRAIGLAYWELEMYDEAEKAFLTSVAQGAEETSVMYNMLLTRKMELKEYTQALDYIETILTMPDLTDSMKQEVLKYEIVCYEAAYDWDTVTTKLETYVSLYPSDEEMVKELEFFRTR